MRTKKEREKDLKEAKEYIEKMKSIVDNQIKKLNDRRNQLGKDD